MKDNKCSQCGAPRDPDAPHCKYCGEKFAPLQQEYQVQNSQTPKYVQPMYQQGQVQPHMQSGHSYGIEPYWPVKNKLVAGLLGIFLGGFGVHKFYLGKIGTGLLYLIFSWTSIPAIVGFIEGIVYIASSDHNFQLKNKVRLKEYSDYHHH